MPCRQVSTFNGTAGSGKTGGGGYATEADCLNACKEGACCEGTTCSVKPACQCQGTGKVFKGVGTTCTPNPCFKCAGLCNGNALPQSLSFTLAGFGGTPPSWVQDQFLNTTWSIPLTDTCYVYAESFDHNWAGSSCSHSSCFAGRCPRMVVIAAFRESSVVLSVRISSISPCDKGYSWNNVSVDASRTSILCSGQSLSGALPSGSGTGGFSAFFTITANPLP